jgi:hypothetical protein
MRGCTDGTDPQLAALLARQNRLAEAIERRATEVVREWMIASERTWLAVDVTRSLPELPLDGEDGLGAAVKNLPRQAFGCSLDVRGSFIVRLADLNGYLGRVHHDRAVVGQRARIEVVIVRDPDGDTDATMFLDGAELGYDDYEEHVIDAGRGHTYHDWVESRDAAIASASPAAAELLGQAYDYPPGHTYIDDAPDGWPFEHGEGQ